MRVLIKIVMISMSNQVRGTLAISKGCPRVYPIVIQYQIFVAQSVRRRLKKKEIKKKKKNETSGKFCNLADDRYSKISMAQATAVEKNLSMSESRMSGEVPVFFLAGMRKKNALNPISRHAVSDITPKATHSLFFYEKRRVR